MCDTFFISQETNRNIQRKRLNSYKPTGVSDKNEGGSGGSGVNVNISRLTIYILRYNAVETVNFSVFASFPEFRLF